MIYWHLRRRLQQTLEHLQQLRKRPLSLSHELVARAGGTLTQQTRAQRIMAAVPVFCFAGFWLCRAAAALWGMQHTVCRPSSLFHMRVSFHYLTIFGSISRHAY
jgi:hypothetical protein